MAVADPFADLNEPDLGPAGPFVREHRRLLGVGVIVVVLVSVVAIGVILALRWLYGATALASPGAGNLLGSPIRVGRPSYTPPMVFSASKNGATVDLRSVTPLVSTNSAGAHFQILVCKRNDEIQELGGSDLSSYTWCHAFTPGTVTIGHEADPGQITVIVAVTASRPGAVEIDGVHIGYRQGIRHGTATSGIETQMWTGSKDPFPGP